MTTSSEVIVRVTCVYVNVRSEPNLSLVKPTGGWWGREKEFEELCPGPAFLVCEVLCY